MLDRVGQPPHCVFDVESDEVGGAAEADPHAWEVGRPDLLGALNVAVEGEGSERCEGVDGEGEAGSLRDVGVAGDGYGETGRGEDGR